MFENRDQFAGFWCRFVAIAIDYYLMLLVTFPFMVVGALFFPEDVLVEVPLGVGSYQRVMEKTSESIPHKDGSVTVVNEEIIKEEVFGKWVYFYRETEKSISNKTETNRVLIDFETRKEIDLVGSGDFVLILLLLYWTLFESGRRGASFGKRIMGIKVVGMDGAQLSWRRALARNLGKLPSAMILLIGFMMAGWTNKKQALHDKMASCLVVFGK